jgi:hypothetical protein
MPRCLSLWFAGLGLLGALLLSGCGDEVRAARAESFASDPSYVLVDVTGDYPLHTSAGLAYGIEPVANEGGFDRLDSSGIAALKVPNEPRSSQQLVLELFIPSGMAGTGVKLRRLTTPGERVGFPNFRSPAPCQPSDNCAPLAPDLVPAVSGIPLEPEQMIGRESIVFDQNSQPGRTLLRFKTAIENVGPGPLHLVRSDSTTGGLVQRTWAPDLRFIDSEAGLFTYGIDDAHVDVEGLELYELVSRSGEVVSSTKAALCLRDSVLADPTGADPLHLYRRGSVACNQFEQFLNPGFADYFAGSQDQQWLDVTKVRPGRYRLRVRVDPNNQLREADESNNVISIAVVVPKLGNGNKTGASTPR